MIASKEPFLLLLMLNPNIELQDHKLTMDVLNCTGSDRQKVVNAARTLSKSVARSLRRAAEMKLIEHEHIEVIMLLLTL
jgi:hypothetical protein